MRRPPTLFLRIARAMTGLVTIWCLGCSGYDPLIGLLLDPDSLSVMSCGSQESGANAGAFGATSNTHVISVSVTPTAHTGFDCGCDSCIAPSPAAVANAQPAGLHALSPIFEPVIPFSVSRVPLLPPPELVAL